MGPRHHRVILRLATVPLAMLCISTSVAVSSQKNILDRLQGKDLWKHRPSQAESVELRKLVGDVAKGFMMEPVP